MSDDTIGKLLDSALGGIREDFREMRAEQRQDIKELTAKVDIGFDGLRGIQSKIADDLDAHEKADLQAGAELNLRLSEIENSRKNSKWLIRTGLGTALLFLSDLLINHLPKWWK